MSCWSRRGCRRRSDHLHICADVKITESNFAKSLPDDPSHGLCDGSSAVRLDLARNPVGKPNGPIFGRAESCTGLEVESANLVKADTCEKHSRKRCRTRTCSWHPKISLMIVIDHGCARRRKVRMMDVLQKLCSVRAQYQQHVSDVDWTLRYSMKDQAACGCGIKNHHEVVCGEFARLHDRLSELEFNYHYPDSFQD